MAYTERPVASPVVSCTWERRTAHEAEHRIVPDACVDLVWTGERLFLAGPDTGARVARVPAGSRYVGVRLRPGAAGAVLGLPVNELRDISPDAADVLGHRVVDPLLDGLARGLDPHALLLAAIPRAEIDPLARAAVAALDRPAARVASVAAELGVSARQFQRCVTAAVGYGPKTLARVLRFRRLQALADGPLVERALAAGYADQAHMTAEVTRLAGLPPVRFLKDRTPAVA